MKAVFSIRFEISFQVKHARSVRRIRAHDDSINVATAAVILDEFSGEAAHLLHRGKAEHLQECLVFCDDDHARINPKGPTG